MKYSILTLIIAMFLLVGCGSEKMGKFDLANGKTLYLSDACAARDGQIYQIGEGWECADGCNSCWCEKRDDGSPTIMSTLMYCGSWDE